MGTPGSAQAMTRPEVGAHRLIREATEAQTMLTQTLAKLAETQGRLQACEEIIKRTRDRVQAFHDCGTISDRVKRGIFQALGPVQ
jgi:vacuolar-type H+-ATPase subunit D/Vma8